MGEKDRVTQARPLLIVADEYSGAVMTWAVGVKWGCKNELYEGWPAPWKDGELTEVARTRVTEKTA